MSRADETSHPNLSPRGLPMPSAEDMARYAHDCLYTPPASFRAMAEEQRTLILSGWGGAGFGLPVADERAMAMAQAAEDAQA